METAVKVTDADTADQLQNIFAHRLLLSFGRPLTLIPSKTPYHWATVFYTQ